MVDQAQLAPCMIGTVLLQWYGGHRGGLAVRRLHRKATVVMIEALG